MAQRRAMIDAKLPSAMKKVHKPAKSKAMQKNKATVHKVHKKPAQTQAQDSCPEMDDVIEEGQEKEHEEAQQEDQEGECQQDESAEKDEANVPQKEFYHFWKSLPEAPRAVQEAVQKVKDLPTRSAKRKVLAAMASAYAMQKRGHKVFKSLQQEWPKAKENVVMPKIIMLANRCGKSAFEQAPCLPNHNL